MNMDTMFFAELIQLNFLSVVATLFMGFFLVVNKKYEPVLTSFFKPMFYFLIILIIVDNIDYNMYDGHISPMTHTLVVFIGYNVRILILLRLVTIMDYNITGHVRKSLSIPLITNCVVLLLSFNTHMVFWFDNTGAFQRGPFGYSTHITMIAYLVYALNLAQISYKKRSKAEAILIIMESFLAVLGTIIEVIFPIRGILAGVIALSMVFYYLHLHICKFYKDPLTGALNRASFYADLKQYEGNITAIYSIDLNGLKTANDTYGHEAGDTLLKTATESLQQCMLPQCYLYRTGGDEFVILCIGLGKHQVQKLTAKLFDCQNNGCDFAFGMHEFTKDSQTTFRMADDAMYTNKRNMKAARAE